MLSTASRPPAGAEHPGRTEKSARIRAAVFATLQPGRQSLGSGNRAQMSYYTGRTSPPPAVWREFFTQRASAPTWRDAHGWCYSDQVAQDTIADIRAKIQLQPDHRIIDVGCGAGTVLAQLLHPGQRGVGVDLCEALVQRAPDFGVPVDRIDFHIGEAADVPLPDNTFDRVLCYSVLEFAPDYAYAERAVRELVRVCAPGGFILIGDIFGFRERFRATLRRRGWSGDTWRAFLALPEATPLRLALEPVRRWRSRRRGPREFDGLLGVNHMHYSHSFFRRIGRRLGCAVEILPHNIPSRTMSAMRFDARLRKSA